MQLDYITWTVSPERLRHEWMRLRQSLVRLRLGFLLVGHVLYFAFCALASYFGRIQNFTHAISLGLWSLTLIGLTLLLSEWIYARMCPDHAPRFTIRRSGVTLYGDDGPAAHFDWRHKKYLRIEADPQRPDFRALILCEAQRFKWLREAGGVRIPLPENGNAVNEFQIVQALHDAIRDAGLTWNSGADGTVVIGG